MKEYPIGEKELKQWRSKLLSGREDIITETLREIRGNGNPAIIPDVAEILIRNPGEKLDELVCSFFNDLKDQDSVDAHIMFLKNNAGFRLMKDMVSSCWQNGLDYSHYLDFFVEVVIQSDYATAIEAFTVVEENIDNLNPDERNKLLSLLDNIKESKPEKSRLLIELKSVISNFSGPFRLDTDN